MSSEPSAIPAATLPVSLKFGDMSIVQKIVFCGKLVVFLCSFGFVFPTLLND